MNFQVNLQSAVNISILRVENGWLIRTGNDEAMGFSTPLKVAETPERLSQIITEWATGASRVTLKGSL